MKTVTHSGFFGFLKTKKAAFACHMEYKLMRFLLYGIVILYLKGIKWLAMLTSPKGKYFFEEKLARTLADPELLFGKRLIPLS